MSVTLAKLCLVVVPCQSCDTLSLICLRLEIPQHHSKTIPASLLGHSCFQLWTILASETDVGNVVYSFTSYIGGKNVVKTIPASLLGHSCL